MDENHVMYGNGEDRVPVFLNKLWTILENPEHANIVCWDESGFSFHIVDQFAFSKNVLPRYFKHNNLNSLVRQLNMYGFRKMTPLERSGLHGRNFDDQLEFSHPYFIRGKPEYLKFIKRKSSGKAKDAAPVQEVENSNAGPNQHMVKIPARDLTAVLQEVKHLREKQDKMSERMAMLSEQNETLWNEVGVVRTKHKKQEQIVQKLVQFLVALVNPSSPSKRLAKRPLLAIDDAVPSKQRRTAGGKTAGSGAFNGGESNIHEILERLQREISSNNGHLQNIGSQFMNPRSQQGPVIAEMDNDDVAPVPARSMNSSMNRRGSTMNSNMAQPNYGYQQISRNPTVQPPQQQVVQNQITRPVTYRIVAPPTQSPVKPQQQVQVQPRVQNNPTYMPVSMANQEVAVPSTSQLAEPLRIGPPELVQNNFPDLDQSDEYTNFSEVIVPEEMRTGPQDDPVIFSPAVDPSLASEFNDYLCGMDQQIDNCRGLIGNNWDTDDYDFGFGGSDNGHQLMLEGPREAQDIHTPELLTPVGGSPVNDAMMGNVPL